MSGRSRVEKSRASSVAATNPGPPRRTQAGAVETASSVQVEVCQQTASGLYVSSCRRAHHSHGTHHLIGAVGAQSSSQPLLSLGLSSSSLSNFQKQPLPTHRRVPLTHAPDRTQAHQGPKPPHASTGVGRDKLGRKIAGELLCLVRSSTAAKG
jgi:hypothetical protein